MESVYVNGEWIWNLNKDNLLWILRQARKQMQKVLLKMNHNIDIGDILKYECNYKCKQEAYKWHDTE